jgi:hypothetical protein
LSYWIENASDVLRQSSSPAAQKRLAWFPSKSVRQRQTIETCQSH